MIATNEELALLEKWKRKPCLQEIANADKSS